VKAAKVPLLVTLRRAQRHPRYLVNVSDLEAVSAADPEDDDPSLPLAVA